jgi:uncharacterized membrane protein
MQLARQMSTPPARLDVRRDTATVVLVLAILATGLAAGFFYSYGVSVTRGLAIADDRTYVETMQAINSTIRNAPFALSFIGAPLLAAAALFLRLRALHAASTWLVAAGLVLYAGGVFAVAFAFNVPLNDELAGYSDLDGVDLTRIRADYESD